MGPLRPWNQVKRLQAIISRVKNTRSFFFLFALKLIQIILGFFTTLIVLEKKLSKESDGTEEPADWLLYPSSC